MLFQVNYSMTHTTGVNHNFLFFSSRSFAVGRKGFNLGGGTMPACKLKKPNICATALPHASRVGFCVQAIGKPHSLWTAFARLYERHGDVPNARIIFQKATEAPFKYVDDLATVWTEFIEMELRHKNFQRAMSLIKQATTTPANLSRRQVGLLPSILPGMLDISQMSCLLT